MKNNNMSILSGNEFKARVEKSKSSAWQWENMFFDWITGKSKQFPPSGTSQITARVEGVDIDHDHKESCVCDEDLMQNERTLQSMGN